MPTPTLPSVETTFANWYLDYNGFTHVGDKERVL